MVITLKPAHFESTIIAFADWISDGKWAIHKSRVANAAIFESEATIRAAFPKATRPGALLRVNPDNDGIGRILGALPDALQPWEITRWTYDGESGRFALATCGALSAGIPRAQVALFGLHTLYGTDDRSTMTDSADPDGRTLVIMPAIIQEWHALAPLLALARAVDAAAPVTEPDAVPA